MNQIKHREVPEQFYTLSDMVYRDSDGWLYWEKDVEHPKHGKRDLENRLGHHAKKRYPKVKIDGKDIYIHQLSYWLEHKELPEMIDHINGDILDYRAKNLRATNCALNKINTNKSNLCVEKVIRKNGAVKYLSRFILNSKVYTIGLYEDEALAFYAAWKIRDLFYPNTCPMPDILQRIKRTGTRNEEL